VKQLAFRDEHANHATYSLLLPDGMSHWQVSGLLDYLEQGTAEGRVSGYLPVPPDPCRHESFRHLVLHPALTLNRPVTFAQDGVTLGEQDTIRLPGRLTVVSLGREPGQPMTDTSALDVSRRNRAAFDALRQELLPAMDRLIDFENTVILLRDGSRATSLADVLPCLSERADDRNQLRLLYRMAAVIHAAPFENISRILEGVEVRSGYEAWAAIDRGYGGVCVEKTAAFKFACDILDVPSSPVLGSTSIPSNVEELVERYVRSAGEEPLPVWIQHHLVEVRLAGGSYLVDATNGNIPLHFLDGADTERYLRGGMRARMVYDIDRVQLRRAGNRTGDTLLTLSEYHVPELQTQYIFEQGLGLHISDRAFVGVYFDWGGERSQLQQNYYARRARSRALPPPRFLHADNLGCIPDTNLRVLLERTLAALRDNCRDPAYTGDFTFVLQPLTGSFWMRPRVSPSVRAVIESETQRS